MQAKELMTTDVVSVGPDAPVAEIAGLLLKHQISAVPVVDAAGVPIGMVSEGDLLGRGETKSADRRDWWLTLLAEGETLHPDFVASLRKPERRARDILSKPLVTVEDTAEASDIARLLSTRCIKRAPVIRGGRIVGIVSRADLVRALAAEASAPAKGESSSYLARALTRLDHQFMHGHQSAAEVAPTGTTNGQADSGAPSVAAFQTLGKDFAHAKQERRDAAERAVSEHDRQQVKELTDHHIDDSSWTAILKNAREAAENGEKQFMLLRFPCDLCSDGGRAINAPLPDWSETLRGEAAEIYGRWEQELKPKGFHLAARVLEFPRGFPGDIGLFLGWGE
jgi:CBS domain-containing protein